MTQAKMIKYLEKNWKSWYTTKCLDNIFKFTNSHANLSKLSKQRLIERKRIMIDNYLIYLYRFKKEGREWK